MQCSLPIKINIIMAPIVIIGTLHLTAIWIKNPHRQP